MECNIIKDLIPLYIDGCCTEESAVAVEKHIEKCSVCKKLCEDMSVHFESINQTEAPKTMSKINERMASVLQSLMLFISFSVITLGVTLESKTTIGNNNGYWAVTLIIPATALLLSLINWYFVKSYKSRRSFSNVTMLTTILLSAISYLWAMLHYSFAFSTFKNAMYFFGIGLLITAVFCFFSKILSNKYAKMLGKE